MDTPDLTPELTHLATRAFACLLAQKPVTIMWPESQPRNGMPLPMKRHKPDAHGMTTQNYRPLDILEYVHEVLSGEMTARRMRDRKTEKADKEPA